MRRLAVDVTQPGRRLPQLGAHRVPVLPQQQDPARVVERDHRDRTRVVDELPDHLGLPQVHGLGHEVPDLPAVQVRVRDDGARGGPVGRPAPRRGVVGHAFAFARPAAAPVVALFAASAAAIRPANSGCARVGRDLNSGCACVAT